MSWRVLIADDNKHVRRAIRLLVEKWPDVEVCAETGDGRQTVNTALALKPDFLILDVRMPELNGVEVVSILNKNLPGAKTILFTMYAEHVRMIAAASGVHVVLPKVDGLSALTSAIDDLLRAYSVRKYAPVDA